MATVQNLGQLSQKAINSGRPRPSHSESYLPALQRTRAERQTYILRITGPRGRKERPAVCILFWVLPAGQTSPNQHVRRKARQSKLMMP